MQAQKIINVRPEEWRPFIVLVLLVALTTASFEAANVVATVEFIEGLGVRLFPVLTIVNVALIVLTSAVYSLVADRYRRLRIIQAMLIAFTFVFLIARASIAYAPAGSILEGLNSWVLYIFVEQLTVLFPLAFWAFCNDLFNVAASKRLFPLLAAGALLGNIVGNWFAGQSVQIFDVLSRDNANLLVICAILCLTAFSVVALFMEEEQTARKRGKNPLEDGFQLSDTWETGLDFVRDVPLFRMLAVTIFLNWGVIAIAQYFLLAQADSSPLVANLQTFLGSFKAIMTAVTLPLQLFVAGRLVERFGLKNMFFFLPGMAFVGSVVAAVQGGLPGAVVLRASARVAADSFDEPAAQSAQGLIPDERRGRVGIFLDSYVYGAGSIFASLLLLIVIGLQAGGILSDTGAVIVANSLAGLMAAGGLYAALQIRKVYDESLLNWRLRRKKRGKSVNLSGLYKKLDE